MNWGELKSPGSPAANLIIADRHVTIQSAESTYKRRNITMAITAAMVKELREMSRRWYDGLQESSYSYRR